MYILRDVIELCFPQICVSCKWESSIDNNPFCIHCLSDIPFCTDFGGADNEMSIRLLGKTPFEKTAFLLYKHKKGKVSDCIHAFKYKRQADIGQKLGTIFGKNWISNELTIPDYIVPIPIHPKKKIKRGYNQCTQFAKGIQSILQVPILENVLLKKKQTNSLVTKGRWARKQNLENSIVIGKKRKAIGKKLLIVDDVITTGATLEVCGQLLANEVSDKLYFGAIALAKD